MGSLIKTDIAKWKSCKMMCTFDSNLIKAHQKVLYDLYVLKNS